jgi:uncharacterized protein
MKQTDLSQLELVDNKIFSQYEMRINGSLAKIEYSIKTGKVFLINTEVPEELAGQGIASHLAKEVFKLIEEKGMTVVPMCKFIKSYIRKHPEYRSLLATGIQLH